MADFDIDERERLIDACIAQLDENTKATILGALLRAVCVRVRTLEAALRECREEIAGQIDADVNFCCSHDIDGTPIESEMDEHSRPMIEESRAFLARIDAALQEGKGHD